jgi:phosphatidate cytidylyltransferase
MTQLEILKWTCFIYGPIFALAIVITLLARNTGWGRNMTQAITSWFVIFILFIGTAFFGPEAVAVLVVPIAILAMREYYKHAGVCGRDVLVPAAALIIVSAFALATGRQKLFYYMPVLASIVLLVIRMFYRPVDGFVKSAGLRVFGFLYWGWCPLYFIQVNRLADGFGGVIFLCSMIALNDNTAYYVGKLLGKNSPKLAPKISPNKTWVGFLGGTIATLLCAPIFGYALPHVSLSSRLMIAAVIACSIPLGDLIESAMKRDMGIKDSGSLIPGHGGVMDRFDSWCFTAPIFYILMELLQK